MRKLQRFTITAFILCAAFIPARSFADDWDFVLAPYALAPSISGDVSVGRVEGADVDVDPGDVLDNIEFGGMVQMEARHKSGYGVLVNYAFMDLGNGASGPRDSLSFDADIFQGVLEGYGTYRFEQDWYFLDTYAGVRWWDINMDVAIETPRGNQNLDRDEDWVDPVIGARWLPRIAEDWRLILQADIGGFGIGSDLSWNSQTGLLWDASESLSLTLQYRLLAVDYEDGTAGTQNRFEFDTITQGPLLGFVFKL